MKDEARKLMTLFVLVLTLSATIAFSQTTEFTYQGSLKDGANPANGNYDFEFVLFNALSGGAQVGPSNERSNVPVINGIFSVTLNFGDQFSAGLSRFLEIRVRPAGQPGGAILSPRQLIKSVPFAVRSLTSDKADKAVLADNATVAASATTAGNVTGIVQIANGGTGSTTKNFVDLSTTQVIGGDKWFGGTVGAAGPAGVFYGNGSGLTDLNASNITSGTLGNARLGVVSIANGGTGSASQNFVDLSGAQTIGGDKTFTGTVGVTGGSGVFNGNGSGLTNLNGSNIANGTVTAAKLAYGAKSRFDLPLLGSLRWDLLASPKFFTVGTLPTGGIAFDGENIWVSNAGSENMTRRRASDGALQGTFNIIYVGRPFGVAFDGANIWMALTYSTLENGLVAKLRASDGVWLGAFAVGNSPEEVAFDGANIWVSNALSNNVTKLRASDGALQGTFAVGTNPHGVAFDGANIWVVNQGSNNVTKLRASDGALLGTFVVGTTPRGVAFDGVNIWVANWNSHNVTKLRASDGALQGTFAVGGNPNGVAFDGANIWVANYGSDDVTKLRSSDGALQGTFTVGTNPRGVAFDGANIWVVNQGSNNVTKLPVFP